MFCATVPESRDGATRAGVGRTDGETAGKGPYNVGTTAGATAGAGSSATAGADTVLDEQLLLELKGVEAFYQQQLAKVAVDLAASRREAESLVEELHRVTSERDQLLQVRHDAVPSSALDTTTPRQLLSFAALAVTYHVFIPKS